MRYQVDQNSQGKVCLKIFFALQKKHFKKFYDKFYLHNK